MLMTNPNQMEMEIEINPTLKSDPYINLRSKNISNICKHVAFYHILELIRISIHLNKGIVI